MNKTEVLERIDDAWRRLKERVEGINPAIFSKPAKDDWSPKDHVAHVTAWEEYLLAILAKRDRYQAIGIADVRDKETDEVNGVIFQARRGLGADVVRASFADRHHQVRSAIESLSDSDLLRPRRDFQPDVADPESGEETLLDEIGWNTWGHYKQHLAWLTELVTSGTR